MVILSIIRTIFYIYLGVECLLISYLYREGSLKYNPNSMIIFSLQKLFYVLGIQFIFMAFIPILLEISPLFHYVAVNILILPVIYLGTLLNKFRNESTRIKR